jgi:hypothetical protein
MTDGSGSRWGFLGGVGGCVLGGLIWVVVAGFTLHDWRVVASAVAVGGAIWWGAVASYARLPTHPFGVLGAVILAVVVVDGIYLALLLPRLSMHPEYPWFGTNWRTVRALRPLLVVGSVAGVVVVLFDLLRRRTP